MPIRKPELDHVATPLSRLLQSKKRARFRFGQHDRIRYHGRFYIYVRETDGGHVLRLHDGTVEESVTHEEMATMVADRSFGFDRGWYGPPSVSARTGSQATALVNLPAAEREHVAWKTYFCRAFRALEAAGKARRTEASMAFAIESIGDALSARLGKAARMYLERNGDVAKWLKFPRRKLPCPKTLLTWLGKYEKADGDPLALRDGRHRSGNRQQRLHDDVYVLIQAQCDAYQSEKRPSVAACHEALCEDLKKLNATRSEQELMALPTPSKEVVRRAIANLPKFETHAARCGIDDARKRFRFVTQSIDILRPGQRVEMDEWQIDVQKIVKTQGVWAELSDEQRRALTGRWVICVAIDVATRVILGLLMARDPSASLALATLRMVCIDKSHLVPDARTPWDAALSPEEVVTDGGPAFAAEVFTTAVANLSAKGDFPPGGMPHLRPYVERFFGRVSRSLPAFFTGRTHANVGEKGGFDPQLRASITTGEFARALGFWVVDRYHNDAHLGLGGEAPRSAWERLVSIYGYYAPPGRDKLRDVFGTEFTRMVSLRGVRIFGLHYGDEALGAEILSRGLFEVTIRVDEDDLGTISLRVENGWRPLPCRTTGLDDVSVETFMAALKAVRERFAKANKVTRPVVLAAVAEIQAIAAAAEARCGLELKVIGRSRIEAEEQALLAGYQNLMIDDPDGEDAMGGVIPIGPSGDRSADELEPPSFDWFDAPRRRFDSEEE